MPADVYLDGLAVTIPKWQGWVGRQNETAGDDRRTAHFGQEQQLGYFSKIIYGYSKKMDKSVSSEIVGQDTKSPQFF